MTNSLSMLEKISGIRQICTVAKALTEKRPDVPLHEIIDAIQAAVLTKLGKLRDKPYASLTDVQRVNLSALTAARMVMGDVLDILGADDTRSLNEDEIAAMTANNTVMAQKRKEAAEKRKAAKATEVAVEVVKPAGKAAKADKKQLSLAEV